MKAHLPLFLLFYANVAFATDSVTLSGNTKLEISISANRTNDSFDLPLVDTPKSIEIIENTVFNGISSKRIEDAVEELPSVLTGRNQAGIGTDLIVRGFSLGGKSYLNGLPDNQHFLIRDPATVDHIEIVKGHDSVIFGSGAPSGTINYVSKKTSIKKKEISVSIANPKTSRLMYDSTGSINSRLDYRFVTALQEGITDNSDVDDDRIVLSPSLLWKYSDKGSLLFEAEYNKQNRTFDFDNLYANGAVVYDTSYIDPRAKSERNSKRIGLTLKHDLNDTNSIEFNSSYHKGNRDETLIGYAYRLDDSTLAGFYREVDDDYKQYSAKLTLNSKFEVGLSSHLLKVGLEKNYSESNIISNRSFNDFTLDIYKPTFDFLLPTDLSPNDYLSTNSETAVFLSDILTINEKWSFTAGIRQSKFNSTFDWYTRGQSFVLSDKDALSTSLGLTYKINNKLTTFISRSESFQPNEGTDKDHNFFDPKHATQYEIGLRASALDNKLNLKSSLYEITQDNLTTKDPIDPDYQALLGEIETKGFELQAAYNTTPSTVLSLSYAYMDGEITKNNDGLAGKTPTNIPHHSGSIALEHTNKEGKFSGLNSKLLIAYVGERQGDSKNSFQVSSYTTSSLYLKYPINKQSTIKASLNNIFDKRYVSNAIDLDTLRQGNRRSLNLGINYYF